MWPYHPDLLAKPVPRYTSYPTAADFGAIPPSALREQIEQASGDISLYLHIPFCEKICFYCGCNTGAAGRRQRVESYLAALHSEIASIANMLPSDTRVRRIAFGGGSPNAILPAEFLALAEALHHYFTLDDAQWSVELDPRSMTARWSDAIAEVGVTRASMGVQTFAPHCQKVIGREQPDELIHQTIAWLRRAGVRSINFDLMYGLPHQSEADLADSLDKTKTLGADRIAVFGYAHVPHMVPRQKAIPSDTLPDTEERFAMASMAFQFLTGHGYDAIGFDHFALPQDALAISAREGTLRRNFQGFTEDSSEILLGFGASAIHSFPRLIAQNEKNNGRYRMMASQGLLTSSHGIKRSAEDQLRGRVIEDLLCKSRAVLSPCLFAQNGQALAPFVERGLAQIDGLRLLITDDGLPYARTIAALFDSYRASTPQRFSSAI